MRLRQNVQIGSQKIQNQLIMTGGNLLQDLFITWRPPSITITFL